MTQYTNKKFGKQRQVRYVFGKPRGVSPLPLKFNRTRQKNKIYRLFN